MPVKLSRVALIAALFAFALAPVARAVDPVAFVFTAEVSDIPVDMGDLPMNLMGSVISGLYVFDADTAAVPQGPGSGTGQYAGAMRYFASVDLLGTNHSAVAPAGHPVTLIQIRTHDADIESGEAESYMAEMASVSGSITDFQFFLVGALDSSAIVGTELPIVPPDPANFATAELGIVLQSGSEVVADILTVPEPASAVGAAAVSLTLAALARRRRPSTT